MKRTEVAIILGVLLLMLLSWHKGIVSVDIDSLRRCVWSFLEWTVCAIGVGIIHSVFFTDSRNSH